MAMTLNNLIGNTPLVDLGYFSPDPNRVQLYAKAEWRNPGGSLKDRPVARMLDEAVKSGALTAKKTVLDSSSGNAGISYAMIGTALGFKVNIVIPGNASAERKRRLRAHGAELIETDPLEGYDEALRQVHALYEEEPQRFFFCDQYANRNNVLAHYEGTAGELIHQIPGPITHFVAGVGTGGSITGIGRRLKETWPSVKIVAVRPQRWPGIEGLKPLGEPEDIVPKILDESLIDRWLDVRADEAKEFCWDLARRGFFVGHSSGAYLAACVKLMSELETGVVATLMCDIGERYFSAGLWD
jgi:cysteine synthase B